MRSDRWEKSALESAQLLSIDLTQVTWGFFLSGTIPWKSQDAFVKLRLNVCTQEFKPQGVVAVAYQYFAEIVRRGSVAESRLLFAEDSEYLPDGPTEASVIEQLRLAVQDRLGPAVRLTVEISNSL